MEEETGDSFGVVLVNFAADLLNHNENAYSDLQERRGAE